VKAQSLLLLYGLDEQTLPVDAECTRHTIDEAKEALASRGWKVEPCLVSNNLEAALAPYSPDDWLVFNLCEGSPGQAFYYARVARLLQERGFAFTGCDADVLDQTQFKPSMKRLLERAGVATPRWTAVEQGKDLRFDHFPAIVKPAGEHCSFGITRDSVVFDPAQARAQAAAMVHQYQGGALVEEFLDSPEYGIALWGEDEEGLDVLGISVIDYDALPELRDRLCTFEAKWIPETEIYQKTMPVCPAPLNPSFKRQLESLARRAYLACELRDYGRIDIRLRANEPMVLDVNANCALSKNAGFPDTARIAGWDYAAVLDRLAQMAAVRRTRLRASSRLSGKREPGT
jgi:D-alanine-D-alanine ligase